MARNHRELCVKNCHLLSTSQHPSEAKLEPRERDEALRKNNGLGASCLGILSPWGGCYAILHPPGSKWEAKASEVKQRSSAACLGAWPWGHWARQRGKRKSQKESLGVSANLCCTRAIFFLWMTLLATCLWPVLDIPCFCANRPLSLLRLDEVARVNKSALDWELEGLFNSNNCLFSSYVT